MEVGTSSLLEFGPNISSLKPENPKFSVEFVLNLIKREYNFQNEVEIKSLPSYDDQNFYLKDQKTKKEYVLKIYSSITSLGKLEMENEVLDLLNRNDLPVPRVILNSKQAGVFKIEDKHCVRLLTFLPGIIFADLKSHSSQLLEEIGRTLAKLDKLLFDYKNVNAHVDSKWDLKNTLRCRAFIKYLAHEEDKKICSFYLDQFEELLPTILSLKQSIIYHDANEYNMVINASDPSKLSGLIDFGDMIKTFTICELAIGCAYCMICTEDKPLSTALDVVRGYHQNFPLTFDELRVLFTLICSRLVISVTSSSYSLTVDPSNEYLVISQAPALRTLRYLFQNLTPQQAFKEFSKVCGYQNYAFDSMTKEEILDFRLSHLGPSLSISYRCNPLKIIRGKRQYLYDESGKAFLDCVNNVAHLGHCHDEVIKVAIKQMSNLNTNTRYLGEEIIRYIKALLATFPQPLSVCFLTCSGSEANDLALRLARNFTKKKDVVVLDSAYHGNLTSLVEISPYKFKGKGGFPCPPHVHVAQVPDGFRGPFKYDDPDAGEKYAQDILEKIKESKEGIAAFICESVLGCAGQVVLPPNYLKHAFAHVRKYGGVCISDEVQIGFGRVGTHFWGFETQDVVPDIVTMGKPIGNGHPMGAVVTTVEIANAFANGMEYFNTFGGNNVSCAIGLKVLEVLHKEELQKNAFHVGLAMKREFLKLKEKHSLIGDVRGLGLFYGIELVQNPIQLTPATTEASWIALNLREQGVLISTDGPFNNVLKIKPPLCFSQENVITLANALDIALSKLEKEGIPSINYLI